jgi:hypothetical protein
VGLVVVEVLEVVRRRVAPTADLTVVGSVVDAVVVVAGVVAGAVVAGAVVGAAAVDWLATAS